MNVPSRARGVALRLLLSLGSAAVAGAAGAAEPPPPPTTAGPAPDTAGMGLDYGVLAGIGYSDNITRAATDETDETMAAVGANLLYEHHSRRIDALAIGSLAYVDYRDNTFDNELIGNLFGDGTFAVIPERFSWALQDNFGQTRRIATDPVTPSNRENVNFFTTGPDITLPLGSRNGLRLEGRYSDVYYEDSDFDNQGLSGGVALFRVLTPGSTVGLHATAESTEYDQELVGIDSDDYEAFVRYQVDAARTYLSVDVGYGELHLAEPVDSVTDGWVGRLDLRRRLGLSSAITVSAGREFSNSADIFRDVQVSEVDPSVGTQPVQIVGSPFESTYARADWLFARNRTDFGAGISYYKEDYETQTEFDRTRQAYYVRGGRQLTRTLRAGLRLGYADEEFPQINREFSETTADATLDWRFGRHVYMSLQYHWIDRSDDVPADEFSENQVWLMIGYSRSGRGSESGGITLPGMRGSGTGARSPSQ